MGKSCKFWVDSQTLWLIFENFVVTICENFVGTTFLYIDQFLSRQLIFTRENRRVRVIRTYSNFEKMRFLQKSIPMTIPLCSPWAQGTISWHFVSFFTLYLFDFILRSRWLLMDLQPEVGMKMGALCTKGYLHKCRISIWKIWNFWHHFKGPVNR